MLYAIEKNKAGRNINNTEDQINWRQLFKKSEDSLTSFVFERLLYLPSTLFWNILKEACFKNDLPVEAGPLLKKEFWPHWSADNTTNKSLVEPDLFLRFNDFDLIIEAKKSDFNSNNKQSYEQWKDQVTAYKNEYGSEQHRLYYIALGGLRNTNMEKLPTHSVNICKSNWQKILNGIKSRLKELNSGNSLSESESTNKSIFEDLILIFRLHGFSTGEWFESMPTELQISHTSINKTSWKKKN